MASRQHCAFCFDTLIHHLQPTHKPPPVPAFDTSLSYPLFVTWTKHGYLRGCIGNFSPLPLLEGLQEYSLTSALQDTRFRPIRLTELPQLSCSVSLLTDFEDAEDYLDWEIGRHGVWIEFKLPGQRRPETATFLPEIASEQGWDKRETIDHLLRKGGMTQGITEGIREGVKLTRYQSRKACLAFEEYKKMMNPLLKH